VVAAKAAVVTVQEVAAKAAAARVTVAELVGAAEPAVRRRADKEGTTVAAVKAEAVGGEAAASKAEAAKAERAKVRRAAARGTATPAARARKAAVGVERVERRAQANVVVEVETAVRREGQTVGDLASAAAMEACRDHTSPSYRCQIHRSR